MHSTVGMRRSHGTLYVCKHMEERRSQGPGLECLGKENVWHSLFQYILYAWINLSHHASKYFLNIAHLTKMSIWKSEHTNGSFPKCPNQGCQTNTKSLELHLDLLPEWEELKVLVHSPLHFRFISQELYWKQKSQGMHWQSSKCYGDCCCLLSCYCHTWPWFFFFSFQCLNTIFQEIERLIHSNWLSQSECRHLETNIFWNSFMRESQKSVWKP